MSQHSLAKATGYTPGYIGLLEMGHRGLSKDAAMKIAEALELDSAARDELLGLASVRPLTTVERLTRLEAIVDEIADLVLGDSARR